MCALSTSDCATIENDEKDLVNEENEPFINDPVPEDEPVVSNSTP